MKYDTSITITMKLICEDESVALVETRYPNADGSWSAPVFHLQGDDFVVVLGLVFDDQFFLRPTVDTGDGEAYKPLPREFNALKRRNLGKLLIALVHGHKGIPLP